MYTIIDIETTGNGIKGNKITEISIFKFDGYEVVEEFTSLVDPECEIPYFITGLTGIDNDTVRGAPKLEEIVPKILEITKDTIFVAHSVNFDYNVIKNEFKNLGVDFVRKKLCTVRLSRKLIPGYNSYSLGKLCSALNIPLSNRHRARGDAHATMLLFKGLLRTEGAEIVFKEFLNARSQEATLPPGLPKEVFEKLPSAPGIYYFKNDLGKIIYVGKAINIRKRVLSHFYDKKNKEVRLCQNTTDIDFELSGNELVALLMESAAIKHHYPEYNRAQKRTVQQYGIFSYEDRNGVMHLAFNKIKLVPRPLYICYSPTECRTFLEELCKTFELCPKFCHLQETNGSCNHYSITQCGGVCRGEENTGSYNERVGDAIAAMSQSKDDLWIKEKGREDVENAIVQIKDGTYCGYGFVPKDISLGNQEDLEAFISPQKNTLDTERILRAYISKNERNLFSFSEGTALASLPSKG